MKISVIQTKRQFAYDPREPELPDLERILGSAQVEMDEGFALIDQAGREGADLIVTVEGFNQSVSHRDPRCDFMDYAEPLDGPIARRFSMLAKKHGSYIVAGLYTGRDGKAYNSAVLFGPDGGIAGVYDKVHHPNDDDQYFVPGDSYPVYETEHGNIAMLVCWDLQYPEAVREMALGGADLIAVPTMGWERIYGYCRAYESCVSLAVSMYMPHDRDCWEDCDPSCIVDNMGRVVAMASRDGFQIVTADLDIRQEPEPQYGCEEYTGMSSMRRIRMSQRRPGTYALANSPHPPLMDRYREARK